MNRERETKWIFHGDYEVWNINREIKSEIERERKTETDRQNYVDRERI